MSDDRSKPKRVRLSGLQEAQLADLANLEQACTAMYYDAGLDGAEVPARSQADIAQLPREHDVFVAEADHVVAGYAAWRDEPPGVGYIEELSVHPDFQRFGVGTKLLSAIQGAARANKIEHVALRCWTKATWARAFYAVMGFTEIGDAAPAKVKAWLAERSAVRPFVLPGQMALWAPVGAAPRDESADEEAEAD